MPPRINNTKASTTQALPSPKAPAPAIMDTLDLVISKRIKNPNQFSAKLNQQIEDYFKSYSHFIPTIYVLTKRRGNHVLSDGALHLITELDEALYPIVQDNTLEFYTHVLVLYGRYFDFLLEPVSEQDVLDGLLCALMISAKVSVGLHIKDMRKILRYVYKNETELLCDILSNHIKEKKSHFSLNKKDILLQHEQELNNAFVAIKNHRETKEQNEFFDEALACLPNSSSGSVDKHRQARNILQKNSYLKQDTLLELESAYLSRMDWRVSLLCNHAQLRQFMMLCWHYGANVLDPAKNNASTKVHHNVLQAFEAQLNDFGKVTSQPPLTSTPANLPNRNVNNDNDDNQIDDIVPSLTFAFDALSIKQKPTIQTTSSSSSHHLNWSP